MGKYRAVAGEDIENGLMLLEMWSGGGERVLNLE